MWIELAHYILLFAMTAVGLQALILSPTLWSKGSALAIKLGFRAAAFSTTLLSTSFLIFLYCYYAKDFSLAVVFETFDSKTSAVYAFSAFCSSREGVFFLLIMLLSFFSLYGFKTHDLLTYQERGRYLFGTSAVIFFMLLLMVVTANPFVRINSPTLEGLGLAPSWNKPYKTVRVLCAFSAYAVLTTTYIKMISMSSKGWHFAYPAFINSIFALMLLLLSVSLEVSTRFIIAENSEIWLWTPTTVLQLSVLCITVGQILILYLCQTTRSFGNWAIFFSLCGLTLLSADFFAAEYGLFVLKPNEAYFPNPVIALCGTLGLLSFFLFFYSSVAGSLSENGFSFFSRESFVSLAATACLTFALCSGVLAFAPTLFLFQPDLPFRMLPNLIKSMMFWHFIAFSILLSLAFRRLPVIKGWVKPQKKLALWFWCLCIVLVIPYVIQHPSEKHIFYWSFPALFLFWSVLDALNFSFKPFPTTPQELWKRLRNIRMQSYGFFLCSAGILSLSIALSAAVINSSEATMEAPLTQQIALKKFNLGIETLSPKSQTKSAKHIIRIDPTEEKQADVFLVTGETIFQWPEEKLDIKTIHIEKATVHVTSIEQISEEKMKITSHIFPLLRIVWNSLFFIELGLLLLLFAWKRK